MSSEFRYPIGGKQMRSNRPPKGKGFEKKGSSSRNRRSNHRRGRGGDRHFGLVERKVVIPELPKTPPPAVFEANIFGKLDERLQYAIAEVGYAVPTPIQERAIPELLDGRDLIGCAQTGTGKTAAFMLPILHHMLSRPAEVVPSHPRALILSPTRELAAQIAENVGAYSKYTGRPWAVIFGGVGQNPQVKAMRSGAETVVATPGRLMDLMSQGEVYLDKVEFFVLDEADRMLDMGFLPDIQRIISKLPVNKAAPGAFGEGGIPRRQSLFFSATLSPQILKLAGELVVDPIQIMINHDKPTVENISQTCMFVEKGNKDNLLAYLLEHHPEWYRAIVFCKMRHGADRVERKLMKEKISAAAIHSDKSQNQRTRALQGFKTGKTRVLVATDIASRGIDVAGVDVVINMELPMETESSVHRIGRTARAGETGVAISFVSPEERSLLKSVERFIKKTIHVDRDHPYHSEIAERKAGKTKSGMPTAPWIRGGKKNAKGQERVVTKFVHPANKKRHRPPRKNFAGRREPDFGQ